MIIHYEVLIKVVSEQRSRVYNSEDFLKPIYMKKNDSFWVLVFWKSTKQQSLTYKTNQKLHEEHPKSE